MFLAIYLYLVFVISIFCIFFDMLIQVDLSRIGGVGAIAFHGFLNCGIGIVVTGAMVTIDSGDCDGEAYWC